MQPNPSETTRALSARLMNSMMKQDADIAESALRDAQRTGFHDGYFRGFEAGKFHAKAKIKLVLDIPIQFAGPESLEYDNLLDKAKARYENQILVASIRRLLK